MSKKIHTWNIEKYEHNHGDLGELIVSTKFTIYHKDIESPVYVFKGEREADLRMEESWESGVESVEFIEDETYILVIYYNGKREKIPLKEPDTDQK
jgi:hypothetical protein